MKIYEKLKTLEGTQISMQRPLLTAALNEYFDNFFNVAQLHYKFENTFIFDNFH